MNEACRLNGVFALVSDSVGDANEALRTYRDREWVEGYFSCQSNDVGCHAGRTENLRILDGRLFVTFLAMCYTEDLYQRIREMRSTLGWRNGDPVHDREESLDAERELRTWLERRSLHRILAWFDAYETAEAAIDVTWGRWGSEILSRDRLFLQKLGMVEAAR